MQNNHYHLSHSPSHNQSSNLVSFLFLDFFDCEHDLLLLLVLPIDLEEEQAEAPIQPHYEHGESSSQAQQEEPVEEEDHDHNQRNPRTRKRPNWMIDYEMDYDSSDSAYLAFFMDSDPIFYEEAVKEKKWKEAKDSEIKSIEKNKT